MATTVDLAALDRGDDALRARIEELASKKHGRRVD